MPIRIPKISTAIMLVVAGIFTAVLASALTSQSLFKFEPADFRLRLGLLIGEIVLIFPVFVYLVKNRYPLKDLFRLYPVSIPLIIGALITGLGFIIVLEEVNVLFQYIIPQPDWLSGVDTVFKTAGIADFFILFIAAVIIAGVVEECLFRGFLQLVLEKRLRDVTRAILYTSLFFAMMHLNPWWAVQIYLIGVFLGYITWASNSVIPAIFVHMMNNLASFLLTRANTEPEWLYSGEHISPLILGFGGLLLWFGGRFYTHLARAEKVVYPVCFSEESLSIEDHENFSQHEESGDDESKE